MACTRSFLVMDKGCTPLRKIVEMGRLAYCVPSILLALGFIVVLTSLFIWVQPSTILQSLISREIRFAIGLSLITSFTVATTALVLGVPVAYAMARGIIPGGRLLETILLIPFGMPPVAVGATLLVFFTNTRPGSLLDELFRIVFTPRGLLVAQFFVVYPIVLRVLKNGFDSVNPIYEAVSRTLGYTQLKTMIHVTLPMASHSVLSAFLLAFIRALGEFGASVTLAGAIRFKTETIPIALYLSISGGELGSAMALIMISMIVAGVSVFTLLLLEEKSRAHGVVRA